MLSAYNTQINVKNCVFKNDEIYDDALNAKYSKINIVNSKFVNIFSDAVDIDFSEGELENNSFINIGGDAIDIMTSSVVIKGNKVSGARDKGISVGEMSSNVFVFNNVRLFGEVIVRFA